MIVFCFIILIPIIVSLIIYTNIDVEEEKIKTVIIQPNIDPYNEKFNRSNDQNLRYLESILNDVKNRLARAEATWDMAENIFQQLADQVRQHEYDIKDLNR